eukprot:8987755-Pyramimonas_sp.AAC.1
MTARGCNPKALIQHGISKFKRTPLAVLQRLQQPAQRSWRFAPPNPRNANKMIFLRSTIVSLVQKSSTRVVVSYAVFAVTHVTPLGFTLYGPHGCVLSASKPFG